LHPHWAGTDFVPVRLGASAYRCFAFGRTDALRIGRFVGVSTLVRCFFRRPFLYLQAEGDYVMIYTPDEKFLKEQTMKYFEEHLPAERFVRIHRSCIVHVDCISKIELYEKQNYLIALKTGQKLRASATGFKQLKAALHL